MMLRKGRPSPRRRPNVVHLSMPSRREAVPSTVNRVLRAVRLAGLALDERDNLAVAVAEALSNAAVHGNRLAPSSAVSIKVTVRPGEARVEVVDCGAGFDRAAIADPTDPERMLAPHGRGLYLMKRLVDRVEYNRAGNRVRLTISRRED